MDTHPHSRLAYAAGAPARAEWTPGPMASLALAAVVTAVPVAAHLTGQPAGLAACVVLALMVAAFAAPALPTALIFSYLFQNTFVALVSPHIADLNQFNQIRAYNFVLTAVAWIAVVAPYWSARASFERPLRSLMDVSTAALVLIGLYFVLGFAANPGSAAIYCATSRRPSFCSRSSCSSPIAIGCRWRRPLC
jgi:hypothetical protein